MENLNEMDAETMEMKDKGKAGRPWKKVVKVLAWSIGIWMLILVILQLVLSPSVLTGAVNRIAAEYVDGEVSFGRITLTMFKHFPNIGISMDDCSVTYPADRYDSLEYAGAQGILLKAGTGATADTLASFKHLSAGINVAALLTGKVRIPHIILVKPRIFAHSYDSLNANWNIFRTSAESDTTSSELPPVSIGRVRLTGHPHIVYTDSRDTIFAIADLKKMTFDGRIDTRNEARNRLNFSIDSLIVAGRIAQDTAGFTLGSLHIHEHNKHLDIHAKADAALATHSSGRMNIPISIKGTASFPKDTVPALALEGFKVDVASIPIVLNGNARRAGGCTEIDGTLSIDRCKVEDVIDGFLSKIIPDTDDISTDAVISLKGTCKGTLGNGRMPDIDISLDIPQSSVSHKDIGQDLKVMLAATAKTDEDGKVNVLINDIKADTYGLSITASGGSEDILGEDPTMKIDGSVTADVPRLASLIPDIDLMTAEGSISADLRGSIRLSQMSIYNFAQADLEGYIVCDSLSIDSPKDSIRMNIDGLDIKIGPETVTSRSDTTRSFRLISVQGRIDDALLDYKDMLSFSGKAIDIAAKNTSDAFSEKDTTKIHPLGGHLNAEMLSMTDAEGLSVSLDNTANRFQVVPKRENHRIPVISLSSESKRIYVRDKYNRFILTDATIKGDAAMNTIERRQKRREILDSLAKAHPDVPADSLFRRYAAGRTRREIPEWMKEEDFRGKDINIRLDESLAKYFREWDINGGIKVRTGILMTPYLPLRNILKGMDISFNNNEFRIDDLKFMSGTSQIATKGSLSGLRHALLGRGIYNLDLDITSDKMDADALIAAFNTGASFDPQGNGEKMEEASDSEFLKMVVADTLSADEPQKLIVIPANIVAEIGLKASNIRFSGIDISSLGADILMKERCMQILNTTVSTNIGTGEFEGFYSTRTKSDISTGFNLGLKDVTTEKVISMMPAIDTIMPLLKSFKGLVNCEFAATASLDTNMNIMMPSINGVIRIGGKNLSLSGDRMFTDLAKKLKFKDKDEGRIDRMTVEGVIQDNTIEVFPFIVDIDRYTLALSGKHNLDQSFRYHASIIRSPLVFKVGVDLYGPDFDNMKFKIGKPKYKNTRIPVFTEVIDRTRINLAESIRGIFEKGVETAVKENERQAAINEHRKNIGFVNAVDLELEELSEEEQKELDKEEASDTLYIENGTKEIPDTLNEQSGIH